MDKDKNLDNEVHKNLSIIPSEWNSLTKHQRRHKLVAFENTLKEYQTDEKIDAVIYSAAGVYAREILIPAGSAVVGEIHLKDQINVVSQGRIIVATEEGVKEYNAPCTFISPAGTKRAGIAITDTVWTTFLATDKTDDKDVYKEFIAPDYEALDKTLEKQKCHLLQRQ